MSTRKAVLIAIICVAVMAGFFQGCKGHDALTYDDMFYREVAWNAMTEQEKLTVTHDWKDAAVELSVYWETEQPAMSVTFNTTDDPLLGPIIAYIEPDTKELLGFALRL